MTLTYFLAQVLGLFCLVLGASLFQKKVFAEVVDDIVSNRALMYMVGVISLGLGLMVVLSHNIWNQGLLPLVARSSGGLWFCGVSLRCSSRTTPSHAGRAPLK
jgi:hypothetical protein